MLKDLSKVVVQQVLCIRIHHCADPILAGTEEQKQKYLVPLTKGEKLGAFGLTEPVLVLTLRVFRQMMTYDGDEWVLNGSKCFITNGSYADYYIIIAITSVDTDAEEEKILRIYRERTQDLHLVQRKEMGIKVVQLHMN